MARRTPATAKPGSPPWFYDIAADEYRKVTQADWDLVWGRAVKSADKNARILAAIDLPASTVWQLEKVEEVGGAYLLARHKAAFDAQGKP